VTAATDFRERIARLFEPTKRGVIVLVDDILDLCRESGLCLEWRDKRGVMRTLAGAPSQPIEVPLQQSVFRAVLARVAALCNECNPNSVSPYGGEGEFSASANSSPVFHVTFANRPHEQRLEIRPIG
jgi:hypothetical protein